MPTVSRSHHDLFRKLLRIFERASAAGPTVRPAAGFGCVGRLPAQAASSGLKLFAALAMSAAAASGFET
jgi:hypothetical protein